MPKTHGAQQCQDSTRALQILHHLIRVSSRYFSAPRLLPLPGKSARRCTWRRLAFGLARLSQAHTPWRGAGVVERGGLENRCGRKSTEGSNPSLSAICLVYAPSTQFDPNLTNSPSNPVQYLQSYRLSLHGSQPAKLCHKERSALVKILIANG